MNKVGFINMVADSPLPWQFGFQDSATPSMEGIVDLHHMLLFYLTVILVFVGWLLFRTVWCFGIKKEEYAKYKTNTTHGGVLEIIWTIIPAVVLGVTPAWYPPAQTPLPLCVV